MRNRYYQHSK